MGEEKAGKVPLGYLPALPVQDLSLKKSGTGHGCRNDEAQGTFNRNGPGWRKKWHRCTGIGEENGRGVWLGWWEVF